MCHCKACEQTKLNPEPADTALYTLRRHRAAGTSPGNPRWYKAPTMPKPEAIARFRFFHGTIQTDPRIGYYFPGGQIAQKRERTGEKLIEREPENKKLMRATKSTADYVRAFCELNGLT